MAVRTPCPRCGTVTGPDARFCPSCGSAIAAPDGGPGLAAPPVASWHVAPAAVEPGSLTGEYPISWRDARLGRRTPPESAPRQGGRRRVLAPLLLVGGAAVVAGVLLLVRRIAPAPDAGRTAAAVGTTAAPAPGVAAAAPAAAVGSPSADLAAAPLPTDSAAAALADSIPGDPAELVMSGAAARGRLTLVEGDSVRLLARVTDDRGLRVPGAVVRWSSTDSARVLVRGSGWVVARAVGSAQVDAASGPLARAVRVTVTPRPPAVSETADAPSTASTASASPAAPSEADARAAADELVGLLRSRSADELTRRLAAEAADGSPAADFVSWVRTVRGLAAGPPAVGTPSAAGRGRARVAVRVPLSWRGGGLLKGTVRRDATFWLSLVPEGGGWTGGDLVLQARFPP